jgi:hypothetical protein
MVECLSPSTCSRQKGRPPKEHASPAPAVAVERDSVVKEGEAGGGAEGNEHVEAGGQEEGADAGAGELAVAAPSGQASAASGADERIPEESAAIGGHRQRLHGKA